MDERERLRELAMEALARHSHISARPATLAAAVRTARQLLALDRAAGARAPHAHAAARAARAAGGRASSVPALRDRATARAGRRARARDQAALSGDPPATSDRLRSATTGRAGSATARPLARRGARPARRRDAAGRPRRGPGSKSDAALRQAEGGSGQLVAILGETGIGKSRLVEELIAHAARITVADSPRPRLRE